MELFGSIKKRQLQSSFLDWFPHAPIETHSPKWKSGQVKRALVVNEFSYTMRRADGGNLCS